MVLMEDGTVRAWGRNSEKQSNPLSAKIRGQILVI